MGHQLDWTGLGSVARGFGLDWIVSTQSIPYSGSVVPDLSRRALIRLTGPALSCGALIRPTGPDLSCGVLIRLAGRSHGARVRSVEP